MVLPLDDERLESLRCSRCHKYLSVLPVKNHSNGEVTCGRCSSDDEDGVRSHFYELVAEKYLFRCVNRYEGCEELLRADETAAHERECVGRAFRCPKCEDDVERSVLELMWHYRVDHPSSYLRDNRFDVEPQSEDVMLHVQDDVVFFISIRYVMNDLYLGTSTLTEVEGTQVFLINKGNVWKKTKKLCISADAVRGDPCVFHLDSIEPVKVVFCSEVLKGDGTVPSTSEDQLRLKKASMASQQEFKIQLEAELKNTLGYKLNERGTALFDEAGHEIDLTCSNCKELIRQPVFRCVKSNHQICNNCRAWCGICKCFVTSAAEDDPLNLVNSHLKYPCRWQCGGYYYASELRTHENTCKFKVLKCQKCPFKMNVPDLKLMKIHLSRIHQIINFGEEYDFKLVESIINQNDTGAFYFMFHNKCCYLKWSYRGRNCYGKYYDFYFGLLDNEPNIKLSLVRNSSFSYNNTIKYSSISTLRDYIPYINFNQTDE